MNLSNHATIRAHWSTSAGGACTPWLLLGIDRERRLDAALRQRPVHLPGLVGRRRQSSDPAVSSIGVRHVAWWVSGLRVWSAMPPAAVSRALR
jgi:hypothetical protein